MAFGIKGERPSIFSTKSLSVLATKDVSPFSYQTEPSKNAKGNHTFAKSSSIASLHQIRDQPGPG